MSFELSCPIVALRRSRNELFGVRQDHLADFHHLGGEGCVNVAGYIIQISGEDKLVFDFACGAGGNMQKTV